MLHVTRNNFVKDGAKHGDLVTFLAYYDVHHYYDASTAARVDGEFYIQLWKYRESKFADIYVTVI